jgi:hypothetical protein
VNAAASVAVTLNSGAVTHTKGAWLELFSSTASNTTMLDFIVNGTSTSGQPRHMLCDIGIGGAGSEVVLVPDIEIGMAGGIRRYNVPIWIPQGTRIAVRYQTTPVSHPINVQMAIYNTGHSQVETGVSAVAYGTNPATSTGTPLTLPGAINTLGAWTQIAASTSATIRSLLIATTGPLGNSWANSTSVLLDVGYGGVGSEQALVSGLSMGWGTTEFTDSVALTVPVNLPAGTRLAARYQANDIAQPPTVSLIGIS